MPVYDGDPEVSIRHIHSIKKEGWNLHTLTVTTHIGTHVNAPIHMTANGKTLDELDLDRFTGPCALYADGMTFDMHTGVIFAHCNIDQSIANQLVKTPPKFIGLSEKFEFDIVLERYLLEHDIISFENLTNTENLPDAFMFYGFPLRIKGGDGSPIRAVAQVE